MSKVVSTFDVRCFKVIGLWQLISSSYSNSSKNIGVNDYESNRSKKISKSNSTRNISDNIFSKSNRSKNISDNIFENNTKNINDDSRKKGSFLHDDDVIKSNSSSYFYLLNVTVMSVFVPYVIMEFFGSMTSRYDFVTLTEKLSVNITLLESAVKFIYCYMRRKQLADLLGVFEENFLLCMQQNRATNLKILENYAKNLTGNINLFIIIIYATVGLWNSLPILSCFQESSCVTLQIMPSWYPIAIDKAPIKQLVYLLEFVIMCYCASLLYSVNCLILAFARMISSQVEILKLSMTSLAQNAAKTVYSQNANNSVYSQNAADSVYEKKGDHNHEVSEIHEDKDNHYFVPEDQLRDHHNARSSYGIKDFHNFEVSEINENMDSLVNGNLLRSDYNFEESEILYRRYQKRVDELQRDCLIDYQRILSQAALMEQTFSPLILFQLAVSTITLCLVLISLTTKTAANSTISLTLGCKFSMYLIFGLMELFVYSWCGHIIQDQTGSLHGSLYEMAWLSNSPKFKKNVLQAMTRALRPCRLTAGKFYPVDFKTFAGVLKMSYSMFTFLYGSGLKK